MVNSIVNEAERSAVASLLSSPDHDIDRLVPGLPDRIVLDCVLPRVPWYARAILMATSKVWMQAFREPRTYSQLSMLAQGAKLQKELVVVHQLSDQATLDCYMKMNTKRQMPRPYAISILEEDHTARIAHGEDETQSVRPNDRTWTWRKLPPIRAFAPLRILPDCGVASANGRIFVMGGWDPRTGAVHAEVYMLNIASGLWEWEAMPPMQFARAFFQCTSMASKIYVVGGSCSAYIKDLDPEVFDADSQTWALLPRVSTSTNFHFNGLSVIKERNLVLAHGFCTTERGGFVSFRRAYDPAVGMWSDYGYGDDVVDDTMSKLHGRDVASQCDDVRDVTMMSVHGVHMAARQTCGAIESVMMMGEIV